VSALSDILFMFDPASDRSIDKLTRSRRPLAVSRTYHHSINRHGSPHGGFLFHALTAL
jgi:hypothetical protein